MGTCSSPSHKGALPPIFGRRLLWPNGWMNQDTTWNRGMPRPRQHCVRWGPSSPPKKGHSHSLFGPCILWPNSWMDATWYEGRPRLWPHCVRWGPSSPPPKKKNGHSPPILVHVYCSQRSSPVSATAEHLLVLNSVLVFC